MLSTVIAPGAFIALFTYSKLMMLFICGFFLSHLHFAVMNSLSNPHSLWTTEEWGSPSLSCLLMSGRTAVPVRWALACVPLLECRDALLLLVYLSALSFSAPCCAQQCLYPEWKDGSWSRAYARNTKKAAMTLLGRLLFSKWKLWAIFHASLHVKR